MFSGQESWVIQSWNSTFHSSHVYFKIRLITHILIPELWDNDPQADVLFLINLWHRPSVVLLQREGTLTVTVCPNWILLSTHTHATYHVRVLDDFGDEIGSGDVISGDLVQVGRRLWLHRPQLCHRLFLQTQTYCVAWRGHFFLYIVLFHNDMWTCNFHNQ